MSSGAWKYKESEIRRGVRALRGAGIEIDSVEFRSDGGVLVRPKTPAQSSETAHDKERDRASE
jgi:hypothetical protein